jgi:hypothetical protein
MATGEVNSTDFSTVQSPLQQRPTTIASANTIAPQTFLTILTGNTVVKTITPPLPGLHVLAVQFAGVAGVDATGNVLTAKASVAGEAMLLVYNPTTAKYVPVG